MADFEKIRKLLTKLDEGKDVSLRDIKGALGEYGVKEYEGRWRNELEYRQEFEKKPVEIAEYEAMLHQADFYSNRADAITHIGKRSKKDQYGRDSRDRLRQQAEAKYEQALEYLDGVIGLNPRYAIWFDRPLDFTFETTLSIDGHGMPRTITSRSKHSLSSGVIAQRTKVVVKREVLEAALERLEHERSLGKDGVLDRAIALGHHNGWIPSMFILILSSHAARFRFWRRLALAVSVLSVRIRVSAIFFSKDRFCGALSFRTMLASSPKLTSSTQCN